jgi:metallothionein
MSEDQCQRESVRLKPTRNRRIIFQQEIHKPTELRSVPSENNSVPKVPTKGGIMADQQTKKCAHPACNCKVDKGKKYCGDYCHDAGHTLELSCNCRHPQCAEEVAAAGA